MQSCGRKCCLLRISPAPCSVDACAEQCMQETVQTVLIQSGVLSHPQEVSVDPEDLELADEDPQIPDGWDAIEACPDVGNHKQMLKATIMFKWDCGWAVGQIKRRHKKGTTYNFFVQYKEDDGSTSQYRQGLKATNYYNDSNPSGVWFVLTQQTE